MRYAGNFSRGGWAEQDFVQCGVYAIEHRKALEQEDDCVCNGLAPGAFRPDMGKMRREGEEKGDVVGMDHNDYAFTAMVYRQKLRLPLTLECDCAFDGFGSPSFTYGLGVRRAGNVWVYDSHVEVTLWEEGLNYWRIDHEEGNHRPTLLWHDQYPLRPGRHRVHVEFTQSGLAVDVDGRASALEVPLWPEGYAGFLACEDMNRFYSLSLLDSDK